MKTRSFLITLFAPFVLYLLAAQAALTTWNLYSQHKSDVDAIQLAVILDDSVSSDDITRLSSEVAEITGKNVSFSSSDEQLSRFKSLVNVDVMDILEENPFPPVLISSVGQESDPTTIKIAVGKLKGVSQVAYQDKKRADIDASFADRSIKFKVLDTILVLAIILQVWMAERLEGAANEQIMADVRAPYTVRRRTFRRRSFIKGVLSGTLAAFVFFALHAALGMNYEVISWPGTDVCLVISCALIILSSTLTYFMQIVAFPIANKNSR